MKEITEKEKMIIFDEGEYEAFTEGLAILEEIRWHMETYADKEPEKVIDFLKRWMKSE